MNWAGGFSAGTHPVFFFSSECSILLAGTWSDQRGNFVGFPIASLVYLRTWRNRDRPGKEAADHRVIEIPESSRLRIPLEGKGLFARNIPDIIVDRIERDAPSHTHPHEFVEFQRID